MTLVVFLVGIQILMNETSLETVDRPNKMKHVWAKYYYHLTQLLNNVTSDYHYLLPHVKDVSLEIINSLVIPRWSLSALGELMIVRNKEKNNSSSSIISIVDFIQNYQQSDDFRKCFRYIDNIISGIEKSKLNAQWNILFALQVEILLFVFKQLKKDDVIPNQWIPSTIKLIDSKILWMPCKIKKYLRIFQMLINTYRMDRFTFRLIVEQVIVKRGQFAYHSKKDDENHIAEDEQFTVQDPVKISIMNNDNLKYNTMYFPRKYPNSTKFFIEHGNSELTKLTVAEMLSPYLSVRYLHEEVLSRLIHRLDIEGYLEIINKPYYDYLSALDKLLNLRDGDSEIWNKRGTLCACLESLVSRSQQTITTVSNKQGRKKTTIEGFGYANY